MKNKNLNNLLTSLFLAGVGIALLNYLGIMDWILNLNVFVKVLIGIVGFVIVVLLIAYRRAFK